MKIEKSSTRKLPRKFEFPWGKGLIIEESSIRCSIPRRRNTESWEPSIQLLQFEDGERILRFCVYSGGRLRRMPLLLDDEQAKEMSKELSLNPLTSSLLWKLLNKSR